MKIKSIITRLTGWYIISVFILAVLISTFLYLSLIKILSAADYSVLLDKMYSVRAAVEHHLKDPMPTLTRLVESDWPSRHAEQIYVRILDPGGKLLVQSPNLPSNPSDIFQSESGGSILDRTYFSISAKIENQGSPLNGATAEIALDLSQEQRILSRFRFNTLTALAVIMILSIFIGTRMARAFFRPIQNIIDKTRRIRAANLSERIESIDLPKELVLLVNTINEMLDRLEDSFSRLSRFSADLAHELRTPINNIRGEMEVAMSQRRTPEEYFDILSSAMEETARISKIIDSLLFLAKTETPDLKLQKEKIDLSKEIANLLDFFGAWASEEKVGFKVDVPEGLNVTAELVLFQRVLSNVLSNAIKYSPEGGQVSVACFRKDAQIIVKVGDSGVGISKSDLPHVFERFYRGDPSRTSARHTGSGLGLTIVKSIMTLHRGSVSLDSEVGRGTTVSLEFPEANP